MRKDGGEAGLVGEDVHQAAAQNDGMADGEGLESGDHQHAATNFRLDIEIVGDFEIVDDGRKDLFHVSRGRHQAQALHAVHDIVFGLTVPGALGLKRGEVVGGV